MATLARPSPDPAAGSDPREARLLATRLVAREHPGLDAARRLRTITGGLVVLAATVALVASVVGLGVPSQDDAGATLVWGLLLVARTALAAGSVYVIAWGARWARAPWTLRTELVDTLTDAAHLGDPALAERLAGRFAAPAPWWSPSGERRARQDLATLTAEVDRLVERRA